MSYSRNELETLIQDHLSKGFFEATMTALVEANRQAKQVVANFEDLEQRDLFGHLQRASFEGKWRAAVRPIANVRVSTRQNKKKTSRFTVARMDRLVITASAVKEPTLMPRYARFRNTLAIASQRELFAPNDEQRSSGGEIYGIITHSTNSDFDLYDAALVVPNRSGTIALLRISLVDMLHAALEMGHEEAAEEEIPEPQLPGIAAKIAARTNTKKTSA